MTRHSELRRACARSLLCAALALLVGCAGAPPEAPVAPQETLRQAEQALDRGDRAAAIALLERGDAKGWSAPHDRAVADWLLGRAYLESGQTAAARPPLQLAADLAHDTPLPDLQAGVLNDLGKLCQVDHDEAQAETAFARGLDAAASQPLQAARIRVNQAELLRQRGDDAGAEALLRSTLKDLQAGGQGADAWLLEVHAASALVDLHQGAADHGDLSSLAPLLRQVQAEAAAAGARRAESESLGELGRLYGLAGSPAESLDATLAALLAAEQAQAPELAYRWEWQAARLRLAQGDEAAALASYTRAIAILLPIRHDLLDQLRGRGASYRDTVGPLFQEYADLLLRRAGRGAASAQDDLAQAREAVEQMKTVELEDYFHDDCVARFAARRGDIGTLEAGTAVVYPILLPDRVELILELGSSLRQFTVPVRGPAVANEALRLRKLLVRSGNNQYLESAQRLYGWLIAPLRPALDAAGVSTLVVVPDGALAAVPFAALHDGQHFLVERYALASVPALHLMEPASTGGGTARALAGGLSDAVQGFPALPQVGGELDDLGRSYRTERLLNQDFTVARLERAVDLNVYSVVHIASHGEFAGNVNDSFLLTYDGHMGLDALERIVKAGRFRREPVDLLTLSACETAIGDQRAAQGLAGVAIKAGARSVAATLWRVDDAASRKLFGSFYRKLAVGGVGKARAMQAAQLELLADPGFSHPAYWAPYLLIGNWN